MTLFTDKLDLRGNKTIALANLSIYYKWQIVKSEYKNNKFKITEPTWDQTFDLPNGSYTITDIQDCFLYILKKHETITSNEESLLIYPNEIKNRIVFKIKTEYKLEFLTNEKMKLLGDELEQVHSVLLHYNVVHNDYLQNSNLLYTFVPNNGFGQLISIQLKALIQSKTTDSIFDHTEIWFTDQHNNYLQIEDSISVTLIIQAKI